MDNEDKSITDNFNSENNINDDITETENNVGNCKNSEVGRQGDGFCPASEEKNNEEEEKAASEEKEDNKKEAEGNREEAGIPRGDSDELKGDGYSAVFEAPFYSPVFDGVKDKKKSEGGRKRRALLITAVSLGLVIALLLGATIGLGIAILVGENPDAASGENGDISNTGTENSESDAEETITIIRGEDGGKRVEESILVNDGEPMSVSGVVNKVAASVVEVTTLTNSYYGQYVSSGAGSGVIIGKSEGFSYIVTNYHVVGDSEVIKVRLNDKREYAATYIDGDEDMDIAVLKIAETENIVQAKIGRSASLTVGEGVVAIGNPLGELGGTVTDGIISALDREINIDGVTMTLLQTNAAINPGNSGGGLFNMYGELIGIVNAKQSASGIEGLGFAIPIDHIYDDIVDVLEDGYIHGRLTFGFEVAYLDAYNAYRYFRTAEAGIYVITSSNSSVNTGDRIISVNSVSVSTSEALMNEIDKVNIGDTVVFGIKRSNGEITVSMVAKEYIPSAATN